MGARANKAAAAGEAPKLTAEASATPTGDASAPLDDGRDTSGRFAPGNKLWEARQPAGPAPKFADAASLWQACVAYFEWVEANPLFEEQILGYKGEATRVQVTKMRAMSKRALCDYLDIERTTWAKWKKDRPDLMATIERVESIIWTQKFEGAAANLLNANIITRELRLAERTEMSGPDGGPIQIEEVPRPQPPSKERLDEILARFSTPISPGEAAAERKRLEALAPELQEYRKALTDLGVHEKQAEREVHFDATVNRFLGGNAETRRQRRAAEIKRRFRTEEPEA
jgi:hypothetical protein